MPRGAAPVGCAAGCAFVLRLTAVCASDWGYHGRLRPFFTDDPAIIRECGYAFGSCITYKRWQLCRRGMLLRPPAQMPTISHAGVCQAEEAIASYAMECMKTDSGYQCIATPGRECNAHQPHHSAPYIQNGHAGQLVFDAVGAKQNLFRLTAHFFRLALHSGHEIRNA